MPTAEDIAKQKRNADEQKKAADQLATQQKVIIRKQITQYSIQVSTLQGLKTKAQNNLSKLG